MAHVEAGLRTWEKYAPFPEEVNRRGISAFADFHFAPTKDAVENLLAENIPKKDIFQTGNTSIDALFFASRSYDSNFVYDELLNTKKVILMTLHRRENFGEPIERILTSIRNFVVHHSNIYVLYPVHPNPHVQQIAHRILGNLENVILTDPFDYPDMVRILKNCHMVMTDSGGLQEEAPSFGKPILVFRESTERPEAIRAGCACLVGSDKEKIRSMLNHLTNKDSSLYRSMSQSANPFGDGTAAQQIVRILEEKFSLTKKVLTQVGV